MLLINRCEQEHRNGAIFIELCTVRSLYSKVVISCFFNLLRRSRNRNSQFHFSASFCAAGISGSYIFDSIRGFFFIELNPLWRARSLLKQWYECWFTQPFEWDVSLDLRRKAFINTTHKNVWFSKPTMRQEKAILYTDNMHLKYIQTRSLEDLKQVGEQSDTANNPIPRCSEWMNLHRQNLPGTKLVFAAFGTVAGSQLAPKSKCCIISS